MKKILVTGGAGFIGSTLVKYLVRTSHTTVINLDKLTYAGNLESLHEISHDPCHIFHQIDICDRQELDRILQTYHPDSIIHLAAESHVDRSIEGPSAFIQTNFVGTFCLLEAALAYWKSLDAAQKNTFRFLHVSTDEVYGDLHGTNTFFTEETPYAPSSPYSASKAGSDHLVRAWHRTYGLPVLVTNCSNNYGPHQFPEKLIPLMILNALQGLPLPMYGNGLQVRDWLYVEDHVQALLRVLNQGQVGETYNIGGHNEKRNIDVVHAICAILEDIVPNKPPTLKRYADLITHVSDRPGHDKRYAIDAEKIRKNLDWIPSESFETGLRKTVQWYVNNPDWCMNIKNGTYRKVA